MEYPPPFSAAWFYISGEKFNLVYTPLLCLFGAMGNCLSVWVFCVSPTHRNLSSSFYLSALAISDTGYLINLLAVWLTDMGYEVMSSRLTCPLIFYLGQVTSFLSVWLTVAFTVERFFAVCYPLTRPTVCTVSRAKKVIFCLAIFAAFIFSYIWVIASLEVQHRMDSSVTTTTSTPSSTLFGNLRDENGVEMSYAQFGNSTFHPATENNCTVDNCARNIDKGREHSVFRNEEMKVAEIQGTINYAGNETSNENGTSSAINSEYRLVCSVLPKYNAISGIANYADSVLTFILPFFLITFLNLRIALCVWRLRGQRDNIMAPPRNNESLSLTQRSSSSKTLKNHLNQSISSRRGSKNKHLLKNGSSAKYPESNANSSCENPSMCGPSKGNENINIPVVKIRVENDEDENPRANGNLNQNRWSVKSGNNIQTRGVNIGSLVGCQSSSSPSSHTAAEVRVTKTLLLVSTVFLVLNLPSHAIRATAFLLSQWGDNSPSLVLGAAQSWSNILFNTNSAVNFLLYCVSGRNFRKSLRNIFLGRGGDSNVSRRGTSIRSMRPTRKSNRMTLNNANANTNGHGHRRDNGITLTKKSNDVEKESLFPAASSQTEIEMETTYA